MSAATPVMSDEVKSLVNAAFEEGGYFAVATVTPDQKPAISMRGTVRTFGDSQLGFWLRNAKGDTLASIRQNPNIALLLHSPSVIILTFKGRARITADEAERNRIYEASPAREKAIDPERKGIGVVVDLDSVSGVLRVDPATGPVYYAAARESA
jgi:hypothetical protein